MQDITTKFLVGERYQVQKYISHGSQAIIYQAQDVQTKQLYALKRYKYFSEMDAKSQQEAISEYEILARINNKNIMRCYDIIQQDTDLYIVAELINGITLEQFVQEQFKYYTFPQINYDKLIRLIEPYQNNKQYKFEALIQPVFKQYQRSMQTQRLNNSVLKLLSDSCDHFNQQLFNIQLPNLYDSKQQSKNVQERYGQQLIEEDLNGKQNIVQSKQQNVISSFQSKEIKLDPFQVSGYDEKFKYEKQYLNPTPPTTKPSSRNVTPEVQTKQTSQEKQIQKQLLKQKYIFTNLLQNHYKNILYEDVVANLSKQLINVLKCLQRYKLIHRDICPRNIMVIIDKEGKLRLKLIDFGLCRSADKCETTIAGTPGFLRPDLYYMVLTGQGKSWSSDYIDIWSFGAVIYYMLHGQSPLPQPKSLEARRFYSSSFLLFPINETISQKLKSLLELSMQSKKPSINAMNKILNSKKVKQRKSLFSACKIDKIILKVVIMGSPASMEFLQRKVVQNNLHKPLKYTGKDIYFTFTTIQDTTDVSTWSEELQSAQALVILFTNVTGMQHVPRLENFARKKGFSGKTIAVYYPVFNIDYKLTQVAACTLSRESASASILVMKQCICHQYFKKTLG